MISYKDLYSYQCKALEWLYGRDYGGIFLEPRMGKTRIAVAEMQGFRADGYGKKFLVIAPKLAATNTWMEELSALDGFDVIDLTSGTVIERARILTSLASIDLPTVVVVNPEVVQPLKGALKRYAPYAVYVDESHLFSNHSAQRTKALTTLGKNVPVRRILTGTPTSNSYASVFAPMRFLSSDIFGNTIGGFRDKYLQMHPMWKSKIEGYKDLDGLKAKVSENAFILRRVDVMEIPFAQEVVRRFDLDAATRGVYDRLVKEYVLEEDTWGVDATHRLSRLTKSRQLTSGFIVDSNSEVQRMFNLTKGHYIKELVESDLAQETKTVVFFEFKEEGHLLKDLMPWAGLLNGDSTTTERAAVLAQFKTGTVNTLIMQSSMGLGFSLAHANHAIFSSLPMRFDVFTQAKDRIFDRVNPISYSYMVARRTVDEFCLATIRKNSNIADEMMTLNFGGVLRGELNV